MIFINCAVNMTECRLNKKVSHILVLLFCTQPPNGAVIVDPVAGLIVSAGHDETGGWINAMQQDKLVIHHFNLGLLQDVKIYSTP